MGKCKKPAAASKPLTLRQQWNAAKPVRPKRPAQGFCKFVAEFSKGDGNAGHGPALLMSASCAWNRLDDNEKSHYESPVEMAQYEQEMEHYRAVTKAMKQPAGAFGLFVQNYWSQNKSKVGGKAQFAQNQKKIAKAWANASQETKNKFKATADGLKKRFLKEQEEVLRTGRPINLNWQGGRGTKCSVQKPRK